ncbi:ABC transporter permease subunit [Fictibacillus sp. KU28468]|uniref:ABC transporter permease subunit n=1 Tax=Fictibacillus sp. KU28468 TaxID=2991053 RepID=UPI0039F69C16
MKLLLRLMQIREASIFLFILLFVGCIGLVNPAFTSGESLGLILKSSMILLVLAVGQSFVLITANIDVSVGSTMGLSAAVCGMMLTHGVSGSLSVAAALLIGSCIGAANGLGVSFFRIPSIIMTLGTLGIVRGYMLFYTEGKWIEDIPFYFKKLSSAEFLGIQLPVWIGIIAAVVAYLFLTRSSVGRYFYAVGDNEAGARLIGLPVRSITVLAFTFSGLSASIAACLFVMNIGFVPNQTGTGIELQVIAAAVLGGVSLSGGQGSLFGAGLGAIFLEVINNSLVFLKVPAYWNNAISGFLLLLIVTGDSRFQLWLQSNGKKKQQEQENMSRSKLPKSGEGGYEDKVVL